MQPSVHLHAQGIIMHLQRQKHHVSRFPGSFVVRLLYPQAPIVQQMRNVAVDLQ